MVEQIDLFNEAEIDPVLDKDLKWIRSIIESCVAEIEVLVIDKNDSSRFVGKSDEKIFLYEIVDNPSESTDYESAKGCITTLHKVSERKVYSREYKQVCRY